MEALQALVGVGANTSLTWMLQQLLTRHENYVSDAERDRARMLECISHLEAEKCHLETKNKDAIEENRKLLDQLEALNTAVIESHSWAIRIEYSHNSGFDTVVGVISHSHCFLKTLSLIVNSTRANRIYIAPIVFCLGMHSWISINF